MKKCTRFAAFLLALLLLLQCAVAADEPVESNPELPAEETAEPAPPEQVQEDPILPPAEPVEIIIQTDLHDAQVVHCPELEFAVSVLCDGKPWEDYTVTCGGTLLTAVDGSYSVRLAQGDNCIAITAGETVKTFTVRFELEIPETWAHDALAFCVDNGILNGNEFGDLCPADPASRAQLAAMLVRLFHAMPEADLSGYEDVPEDAWFYGEMARAVAMGIFEGSGGKLTPQKSITREQAFTVLARAFGVGAETAQALSAFTDADEVSPWAVSTVAGMLEAGYVHGKPDGSLNPKGNITRQELAQVLYNALDCITDDPTALTGAHNLYTGPVDALTGEIPGDLILSCDSGDHADLSGFTAKGRLVLHLHSASSATVNQVSNNVSVCSPIDLTLESPIKTLTCIRDGATIRGKADRVLLLADTTLAGYSDRVIVQDGNHTVTADATIKRIDVNPEGTTLIINGSVDALDARQPNITLKGNGCIDKVWQHHFEFQSDCRIQNLVEQIDAGLRGVTITPAAGPTVYYDQPEITLTAKVTGVDSVHNYDVPGGVRTCTVIYTYRGKVIKTDNAFKLTEGAQLSVTFTPEMAYHTEREDSVQVTLRYGEENVYADFGFTTTGRWSDLHEAQNIQTIHVLGIMNYTTTIYSYSSLTGKITTLAAGTSVHFLKFSGDGTVALIETLGGTRGWCAGSAVHVSWQNYHNDSVSYSDGVKEAFVNQVHNYSSPSKYLIWCNLYTTTVNVFEGYQGHWKLIKSSECAIGAPNSPTRPGVFSIYSHAYYWSFDSGGRADVSRCYYASLFDGGIAFHTRLYYTGTSTMVSSSLSVEVSHGCVRCPDDMAIFIYNQCPIGTTVVVY